MMKQLTVWILLFMPGYCYTQSSAENYFNKIRNNTAELTAFFSQMPKGGDLHHHYSGALYAEPMLENAISNNFYINTVTLQVAKEKPGGDNNWEQFSAIIKRGELYRYKQLVLQKWSVKDYNGIDYPSDKLFFESFGKFWPAAEGRFKEGLTELKERAVKENVSYIETQLTLVPCNINLSGLVSCNDVLRREMQQKNEKKIWLILDTMYNNLVSMGAADSGVQFSKNFIEKLHGELSMDDNRFTVRYQNFVLRFKEPVDLFKDLIAAFASADNSNLVVGVNIVSPEDGETSMKDYRLHMLMYKYLHTRYPKVKYAMHAGELALGMVMPEELTWHINDAVYTAGASRIGHGVDLVYENHPYNLLRYMAANKIAVEINLVSNEFILKVKEDAHPVMLYKKFDVPVVISSDDAGVLRTNLTEQFVLLAKRYKEISYSDIKRFVYNSIQYSLIEEDMIKKKLKEDLDKRFKIFEASLPLK